jgi:hypothetical protein
MPQKQKRRAPCDARRKRHQKKRYSNFSAINVDCGFALASDFATKPSADSEVVFRAVAIWLKI